MALTMSMSLCRPDLAMMQPGLMQHGLPTQIYSHGAFEGILELRKEKSRDAARSRRGKENYEFYELAKMLPLPGAITSQLDKASIIRLTISYLKLRDFSCHGDPPWQRDGPPPNKSVKGGPPRRRTMNNVVMDMFEMHQGTHILQSLDGFAFALSNDGRFLYISETVSIYLGLSQVEMTGSSVFDYIHRQDQQEMAEQLGLAMPQGSTLPSPSSTGSDDGRPGSTTPRPATPTLPERASIMNPSPSKGFARCFCIRMKSTLTKRGVHVKCSGYRVVQILAHMRPQFSFALTRKHPPPLLGLVAMAIALPPPTITELVIDNDMFVTRLSPEFKITYVEPRISDMMDISADDLMGKNIYDYCHAEDLQKLRKAHVDLLNKGQVLTDYYRLMNKHGGYVWIQTCATIICNVKNAEDQNIIAINYILSGVEYPSCVMNMIQLKVVSPQTEPDQSDHSENEQGADNGDDHKSDKDHKSPGRDDKPPPRGSKRKRSPCEDNNNTNSTHDIDDLNTSGAAVDDDDDPLQLMTSSHLDPSDPTCPDLYNGDDSRYSFDKHKVDAKNSRRKMDKPRKRKRELDCGTVENTTLGDFSSLDGTTNGIDSLLGNSLGSDSLVMPTDNGTDSTRPGSVHSTVRSPATSPQEVTSQLKSPAPEDLSVRAPPSPRLTTSPQLRSVSPVAMTTTSASSDARDHWLSPVTTSSLDSHLLDVPTTACSTVRDLEEVMNKHLPVSPSEADHMRAGLPVEYNPSLLGGLQKHKSTIQWIGSQTAAHMGEHLPATSWLRSLYASRESVIRSNVYPRPQYYRSDMQNSLLTPPGTNSDHYKDASYSTAPLSQAKTPPTTYSLMTDYSNAPITVSMANMTESYSMTPPSSVSPHDKYASPFVDQLHMDAGQYRQYNDGTLAMPIKPQAYPLPAHANTHMSVYDRATATAQYPTAGYYGTAAASFPAYSNHTSSPSPYRDSVGKSANGW